ncbi:MAG TPA: hypothetical protein VFQ92_08885, partial [Blastocatellia bacterium]|nr:hypothetical protein [Blastocatellia bacterium]
MVEAAMANSDGLAELLISLRESLNQELNPDTDDATKVQLELDRLIELSFQESQAYSYALEL